MDRVRNHVLYKAKLDSFKGKMPTHRTSISEMATLIGAESHSERRASIGRLHSFLEEHERGRRKDEEDHRSLTDALGLLEETIDSSEDDMDPVTILRRLGDELTAGGREKRKVEEQMNCTRDALADEGGQDRAQGPEISQLEKFRF